MRNDQKYPEWLLWFSEHGVRVLILLAIAFLAFVYSRSRSNTEQRLDAIRDSVQFEPPRSYTPPNLDHAMVFPEDGAFLTISGCDRDPGKYDDEIVKVKLV